MLSGIFLLCLLVVISNACADDVAELEALPDETQPRRIIPIGNLEILGSYSDIDEGSDLWGFNISGSFAPVVRLNDKNHLIPLYHGAFKRMRQFVAQEEGGRLYNTWQIHNGSLALRTKLSDKWSTRLTALGTWNFVKETRDESFSEGLYDYRDFGSSIDTRYTNIYPEEERQRSLSGGLQYFRREYPNFRSLISLATATAPEENEKDFDAIKLSAGFEDNRAEGLRWQLKSSLLLKYFVDKRLIGEDGVLDMDKKRRDYVVEVNLNGAEPFSAGRWEIGLDNAIIYNNSNLAFYDSRDTIGLDDDVFTEDYYTYFSAVIYPHITFYHHLTRDKRLAIRLGYSYLLRDYEDRKAQDSDGTYTNNDQQDTEHALHVSTSFPITKSVAWITDFDYTLADSNQNYEAYYRYEYDVYQIQAGISLSF